jgi:4-hydroxy-tetrahydrodipicolinate reductase
VSRLRDRIRIGIVGLGWVGQEVSRAALEDPRVRLVGVADVDPMKANRDLGEIIGEGRLGVPIDPSIEVMLRRARPEVAVLCTTSDVEKLASALETCVAHGAHVVTTCENLADPEMALAQLEPDFEQRVRKSGLVVLATGVNPGFAMDRLPVMLTQATRNIRRVRVVRVVNASTRRAQLQSKIGVGMTPQRFADAIKAGEIGHAGLSSSLRLLAKGLGITLEKTSEAFTPLIADHATSSSVLGPVKAGNVRGIYQIARGYRARREVITLELTMALDEPNARDTIDIVGEPPLHFEGELPGDSCTVATVLSAISVIVAMPAGLRTVLDVPLEQPEEPQAGKDQPPLKRRGRETTQLPSKRGAAPARAETVRGKTVIGGVPKARPPQRASRKSPASNKRGKAAPKKSGGTRSRATGAQKKPSKSKRAAPKGASKRRPAQATAASPATSDRKLMADGPSTRGRASKDAPPTIIAGGKRGLGDGAKNGHATNGDARKKSQPS